MLDAYATQVGVDAVMLSGSTARGDADRWSDVEVGVFWSRPPSSDERSAVAEAVRAAELRMVTEPDSGAPWYDHIFLGAPRPYGLMVEVVHTLTDAAQDTVDTVLESCIPDPAALDAVKGIADAGEIVGSRADLVDRWRSRARIYPRDLAIAVVERYGVIEQFWRWRMLVDRDNPLLIAREFTRVASQLLYVVHALNGRYCGHPSHVKRLDALEHDLPLAPNRLSTRLRRAFTLPTPDGAEILRGLVEETYDLVEVHLPEVDVQRLRDLFRSERQPLEGLPGPDAAVGPDV